jgi:putative cardiolipin synthase
LTLDRRRISCFAAALALALAASGCATLPPPEGRTPTTALGDTAGTRLGRALAPAVAAHPGLTGIHPLSEPHDAFAARVLLAAAAERSIDAQYYIWQGDEVGDLLFEALWQAAERGVRVRLLLDDLNTGGLDRTIAALDAHPNIEVRLYNPLVLRGARLLNFLGDFDRVNRRMHNKSFTVDGQASVIGGRNIGNEYFAAGSGVAYADLDVIAVGAAVREISRAFDVYWNSPSAYPAAPFAGTPEPGAAADLEARFAAARADPAAVAYLDAVRGTPSVSELVGGRLALQWASARLVYDDPAKTLDTTGRTDVLLFPALVGSIGRPQQSFDLVSPYFVPGAEGTAALAALAEQGVRVRVLTNSLASTHAGVVHSGYAKRREDLLRAGVRLYELKPTAARASRKEKAGAGSGSGSSTGLHAKTFAVDGRHVFVGSFNFDRRSALLNTEMGLVVDSPLLARDLGEKFDRVVPEVAWEAWLDGGGGLQWIERSGTGEVRHDTEPETTWLQRRSVDFYSILPIDWML